MRLQLDPQDFNPIIQSAIDEVIRRIRNERPTDGTGRLPLDRQQAAEALLLANLTTT